MNIINIENFLIILLFSLAAKKEFTNGQSSKNNFYRINNKDLKENLRQEFLLKSIKILDNLQCILACKTNILCSIAIVDTISSICNIYQLIHVNDTNTIYSFNSIIFVKNSYNPANQYLTHYWPFNGDYREVVSNSHLSNGTNYGLVTDRFGQSKSSLYMNYGQLQGPSGYYIYGDFTLMSWVKMYALEQSRRFLVLVPFNGAPIYFCLTSFIGTTGPYYYYLNSNQISSYSLSIGKWQHVAYTIKGTTLSIYIDGMIVYSGATTKINFQKYSNIYIGAYNGFSLRAEFDDIKIFNKSLTNNEIIQSSLDIL